MITFQVAQVLQNIIGWVFAYFIIIGPIGLFKVWIADKMGDPTMAQHGMLTINPMMHINLYNLFILLMMMGAPSFFLFGMLILYYSGVFGTHVNSVNPWIINDTTRYLIALFLPLLFNILIASITIILSGVFEGIEIAGFFSSFAPVLAQVFLKATFFLSALTLLNFFNALVGIVMHVITREYSISEQMRMVLFAISIVLFIVLIHLYGATIEYVIRVMINLVANGILQLISKVV